MPMRKLGNPFESTFSHAAVLVFIIAFTLRLIPEILAGIWPLGFDTVTYYVPTVLKWTRNGINFTGLDSYAPLGYLLVFLVYLVTQNMFLSLKLTAPLLYGLFALSFFFFTVKGLNWDLKKGFLSALLFSFYFVSLRIGWDLYRNMLGLTFLLLLLPFLQKFGTKSESQKLIASLLTIVVVLSHEIAGILALFICFGGLILDLVKRRKGALEVLKLSLWFMPSLLVFMFITYLTAISIHAVPGAINYYTSTERGVTYASYQVLAFDILGLFPLIFGLLLPLVIFGFWRNQTLELWSLIGFAGSFWPLFCPWFEIIPWNRWMYMLDIPFIIYATNGLDKLHMRKVKLGTNSSFHKRSIRPFLFFIPIGIVSVAYIILPQSLYPYPNFTSLERLSFYIPAGMLSNTFPLNDNDALVNSLKYVNGYLNNESVLIIHESLTGWSMLYLSEGKNVINYHFQPHQYGLQEALSKGYKKIYLIWWTNNYGWYGQKEIPRGFEQVFVSSRIAVYLYEKE